MPLSEQDFDSILVYLRLHWDDSAVDQFIEIVDKLVIQICINPRQFPIVNKSKKVRKCIITKHNAMFYREQGNFIEILRIFDTRQNPKKLRFQ